MNAKGVLGAFLGMIFKIVLWAIIVMVVYRCAIYGYAFGFSVFSDRPIATSAQGMTVNVVLMEGKSNREIAELLKEKGLIKDANVFYVQLLLSDYKDKLKPGIYDLSTSMTAEEMMQVMAADAEGEEDQERDS